jgi:hypothetical protein
MALPGASARELRAFLRCGILAHGIVRAHCDGCGFCPSCGGRRMADTAAHLVDRVLPEVPVRQWVLSLPFALRYRLAFDAPLEKVRHLTERCASTRSRHPTTPTWSAGGLGGSQVRAAMPDVQAVDLRAKV